MSIWKEFLRERPLLTLYACTACGHVSTVNFRDDFCQVCRVAMKVEQIEFRGRVYIDRKPAPHTAEADD